MPSPARLLQLTGSACHGELGFNRWKKIWVYPSVPVNSQPCGDCQDPQLVTLKGHYRQPLSNSNGNSNFSTTETETMQLKFGKSWKVLPHG